MDILINAANILYVVAYFTLDMLRLRVLTTSAAVCLVIYFYNQPEPMLNVVAWNLFFVALNLSQIVRILMGRAGFTANRRTKGRPEAANPRLDRFPT